jgi:ribosome-binding protein aMBF1 (putative translation factor)
VSSLAICGYVMRRRETPGHPVLEDPVCGRRPDHPGRHRSEASMRARARLRAVYDRHTGSAAAAAVIREARTRAGKSQSDLAAVLGVSQQCVQHWEAARRMPPPEGWVQLELTLGPLGVVREIPAGAERAAAREAA